MKLSKFASFFFIIVITSCQLIPERSTEKKATTDGTRVIKSYFEKSGDLKTEITVKDNKKHGPAKKYYATGELHTLVYYNNGIKEGETVWYYKNGQPYRVTPYKNGKMHGIRKKYYEDGTLQAEIPYDKGELIEGTKEYNKDGILNLETPKIKFETIDLLEFENKYVLKVKLSKNQRKVQFFEERTSTAGTKIQLPVTTSKTGVGRLEYYLPPGSFKMAVMKIYASYETKLRNPVLISSSYNLAIENR